MEETADLAMEQETFKARGSKKKKHKITVFLFALPYTVQTTLIIILYHYKQKRELVEGYGVFLIWSMLSRVQNPHHLD